MEYLLYGMKNYLINLNHLIFHLDENFREHQQNFKYFGDCIK